MHAYVRKLMALKFANVFNPYSDTCAVFDRSGAPRIRARALSEMIIAAENEGVDSIWIGRDLGHRGGRRTGLALTDDIHVPSHAGRWGLSIDRATRGEAVAERTASVVWGMLDRIDTRIFLWNVFPLHPFENGKPFSNRTHNAAERAVGRELLHDLIGILKPAKLVAIGNDAASAIDGICAQERLMRVRHPSYGGQSEFISQITSLYTLAPRTDSLF